MLDVSVSVVHGAARDHDLAARHAGLLERVGRVESVGIIETGTEAAASATALLGEMRLLVPMQGLIDVDAEKARLDRQRQSLNADLQRSRGKLGNENFVNNAPAAVVTQETERVADFERRLGQLDEQLERLNSLN